MLEKWRGWNNIGEIGDVKVFYQWGGVYVLRLVNLRKTPIKIGRFLRKNETGIIQIGKAKNLGNRLNQFYKACMGEYHAHSEGSRLFLIRMVAGFEEIHKNPTIQFNVKLIASKEERASEEERLLKCYFIKFGELPPLNCQVEDYKFKWANPDCSGIDLW